METSTHFQKGRGKLSVLMFYSSIFDSVWHFNRQTFFTNNKFKLGCKCMINTPQTKIIRLSQSQTWNYNIFFYGCTCGILNFLGQGLNPSCRCSTTQDPLTHCARLRIDLVPPQKPELLQLDSQPTMPQWELQNCNVLKEMIAKHSKYEHWKRSLWSSKV